MRQLMVAEFMSKNADNLFCVKIPNQVIGKYDPPCFTQADYRRIEFIGLLAEVNFIDVQNLYFANPGKLDDFLFEAVLYRVIFEK